MLNLQPDLSGALFLSSFRRKKKAGTEGGIAAPIIILRDVGVG